MSDLESQKDELLALESIYTRDEFQVFEEEGLSGGKFAALLTLPSPLRVSYEEQQDGNITEKKFHVRFLPPVVLQFSLPTNYPSVSPPSFTLSCSWLNRKTLSQVCRKLDEIWNENQGMEVLYNWTQFLKEEILTYLDIDKELDITNVLHHSAGCQNNMKRNAKPNGIRPTKVLGKSGQDNIESFGGKIFDKGVEYEYTCEESETEGRVNIACHEKIPIQNLVNDKRAVVEVCRGTSLVDLLKEHDEQQTKDLFNKEIISCQICFQEKLGQLCVRFDSCGHVFCKECVTEYFEVQIKDGNVHSLNCPEHDCKKQALPSLVKDLVSPELFARYDSVLLSSTLDTLTDIIYCPRSFCQYPVTLEAGEKMAHCPNCEYVFCVYCKMVYHGVAPCQFKSGLQKQLVKQYQNAGDEERAQLEQKYGKKQIQNLVDTCMSETWITDNSQSCPTCLSAIEKSQGCNKMVCWKCNTMFCWLCKTRLNPSAPYLHFNSPNSPCYNLLFQGVHDDDDGDDDGWILEYVDVL
ncbi:E3 ubiquitin-protein ligase RNF14-like [Ischnura elegans]|uniref:E3 ubiquitin-protein ligase RNF14-like n=1 Tax=Ischnura elegans TaxID=197161 RepID=UPI001ED8B2FA|nr:E3 ubiquitin-protein ligase RNF14-like [Ischnura elegans]